MTIYEALTLMISFSVMIISLVALVVAIFARKK